MFSHLYNSIIFLPLYNGLIFLMDSLPWIDAGVAVILFTIIIRFILFPLSRKAIITQVKMREIQPQLDKRKVDYKNDTKLQGTKMMELYKNNGVNPFSSVLLIFIQLPIIYALYTVFIRSGLPTINTSLLYSFVHAPHVTVYFLGLVDITKSSIFLSLLAAVSQYLQLEFSLRQMKKTSSGQPSNAQADMTHKMTNQMKYIFPVMIFIISYRLSAVLPLYWMTTNLFTLVQELVVRRKLAIQAKRP